MIILAPLIILALIALSVRGRRVAPNFALLAPLLSLAGVLLAGAAGLAKTAPYDGSYEWLNVATAFSGPSQFQTYINDIGIRISHLTTLLALGALAISLAVVFWSRAGARGEPSPARYYALLTLLLTGTLGVIVSTDLAELYVFWGTAAAATYLLLSNSWSDEVSTRQARLALAVPALADLALLAGIALLYSRYGQLNLDQLIPQLLTTQGAGPKALATACVLIFAGAAGRLGLFPFHGWLTAASDTSPGALAAVQGFWTLIAAGLLFKVMPLFAAANAIPYLVVAITAAVTAIVVPLVGLAGLDARRSATAAGIGVSALAVLAFATPRMVAPAALLLAATGLARCAASLATGTLVAGMRTPLLSEMGEGYRRLRLSVLTLPLAAIGLVAGVGQVAGGSLRWYWTAANAIGLGLAMFGLFRIYFLAGHGLLPRRRGFDPNRVRAAPATMTYPPIILALLAAGLSIGLFSSRLLSYADHLAHHPTTLAVGAFWIAVPLLGALLAALLYLLLRPTGQRFSIAAARVWTAGYGIGRGALSRVAVEAPLQLVEVTEERALAGGEDRLANLVSDAAAVLRHPLPLLLLPILVGLAVLVAVVAGLIAPGVYR
jgi:NADH:ubiquinone oxidoreductase subunit 5 (subunit L)/multisubunit Na+/H+ antiporter MnhA subunit